MCDVNLCTGGDLSPSKRKRYCERKSPPHSAAACAEGSIMGGNDGNLYIVKANKNGTHRWVKARSGEIIAAGFEGAMPAALMEDRIEARQEPAKKSKKKPAKKSKKKPAKKSSRKPKAKKSSKKKTIAQIRAECKEKGLVYDRETKRCRKSKRGKKKSPAKKSKKSSRKPKAKKSKKKKKTIAQIRAECKKKGLVYDRETKKCRKSKRGKKSGKKSPKKSGKKSKKMYAKGDKDKCGKMPARLKRIKTPKVCVKVLTGPNKGKHKYVTKSAAQRGGAFD